MVYEFYTPERRKCHGANARHLRGIRDCYTLPSSQIPLEIMYSCQRRDVPMKINTFGALCDPTQIRRSGLARLDLRVPGGFDLLALDGERGL